MGTPGRALSLYLSSQSSKAVAVSTPLSEHNTVAACRTGAADAALSSSRIVDCTTLWISVLVSLDDVPFLPLNHDKQESKIKKGTKCTFGNASV